MSSIAGPGKTALLVTFSGGPLSFYDIQPRVPCVDRSLQQGRLSQRGQIVSLMILSLSTSWQLLVSMQLVSKAEIDVFYFLKEMKFLEMRPMVVLIS